MNDKNFTEMMIEMYKGDEEDHRKIFRIMYLVLSIPCIIYQGLSYMLFWNWLLVPLFGLMKIAILHGISISFLATFLKYDSKNLAIYKDVLDRSSYKKRINLFIVSGFYMPSFIIILAFILKLFL